MTEPDNAHDAAVERVAEAIDKAMESWGQRMAGEAYRPVAEAAIAAYKQGQVTDEKLWAEYKAGQPHAEPATLDRRRADWDGWQGRDT